MIMNRCKNFLKQNKYKTSITNKLYSNFPIIPEINYSNDINWNDIYELQQPIVIRSMNKHWDAIVHPQKKWSNLKNLKNRIQSLSTNDNDNNGIIVPIEIGESYMDTNLQKGFTSLDYLLDYYMTQIDNDINNPSNSTDTIDDSSNRIYLAQHEIDEIPILRDDIQIPDICITTGKKSLYKKNIWFGGNQGTIRYNILLL